MLGYFLPFTSYPFVGQMVDCPVCASTDHSPIGRMDRKLKRLKTDLCNACGLFFHNPMPTEAELAAYYATCYRFEYQFLRSAPSAAHQMRKAVQARKWVSQIATNVDLSQPIRTLDCGCGSGELVRHLADLGHDAHGLEPGECFADHAAKGAPGHATIHRTAWQTANLPEGGFDLITSFQVIEHMNDPVGALMRIRDWLAPGGVALIDVPDMAAYTSKGFDRFHFAHTLGFSRDNLLLALERAGLAPIRHSPTTSFFAVRADHRRAIRLDRTLVETAKSNRRDYAAPFAPKAYVARHLKRIRLILGHQFGHYD